MIITPRVGFFKPWPALASPFFKLRDRPRRPGSHISGGFRPKDPAREAHEETKQEEQLPLLY